MSAPKTPAATGECRAARRRDDAFVEAQSELGRRGGREARAVAGCGVGGKRELADDQQAAGDV